MEIKPLNVIVYNQDKVNIEDVVAPPYDVIDSNYQNELYERSDYNIVRLILAKGENRYEDAKNDFNKWLEEKVLTQLDKPCILYIVQKYTQNFIPRSMARVDDDGFLFRFAKLNGLNNVND